MEIDKFIKVYDDVFHFEKVASLIKYASDKIKFNIKEKVAKTLFELGKVENNNI